MKKFVNTVAIIAFIIQSVAFVLNIFCMKKPEDNIAILWNYFAILLYLCSDIIVLVFILYYNYDFKMLKNKVLNFLIILTVMLAGYIHIWQIIVLRDFILTSCILVLFDIYIANKNIQNIINKENQ